MKTATTVLLCIAAMTGYLVIQVGAAGLGILLGYHLYGGPSHPPDVVYRFSNRVPKTTAPPPSTAPHPSPPLAR